MKVKSTMLAAYLLAATTLNAQILEWARSLGGRSSDEGQSVSVDASGNVYTTGYFEGTVDFDPGSGTTNLSSAGESDIFVQKLDASGNFLWARSFGDDDDDEGYAIYADASGNVYITGSFEGTVDFDPGSGTANLSSGDDEDVFILNLDASGNLLWARSFGGNGDDEGYGIHVDGSGNVYTTGYFEGTVDFDPGSGTANLSSAGGDDVFVHKLDASGNFLWARTFGGNGDDEGYSIHVDASGNAYTTGNFVGTVDFDPGSGTTNLSSAGSDDIFVQKLDASGNFLWARSFGGNSDDGGYSISVDASGTAYTTGYFKGTVDFDPGAGTTNLSSAGESDIFVQKLDASGNFLWARSFGDDDDDEGQSITLDNSGNVYTTGSFEGTVDFEPGSGTTNLSSDDSEDVFVLKLDASGDFLWAVSFGGDEDDEGYSIHVDASGNVYTTGYFERNADFDPGAGTTNLSSAGESDIFVQKLGQCAPTTGTDTQTACGSYTWIDGNTYTASNNTATFTLTNSVGCDSVVTLDLTINSVSDITTVVDGLSISANNGSATYQWLDCDNNFAIISGETAQTFTATASGNYAVELTENGCVDTSACVMITITSTVMVNTFGDALKVFPNPTDGLVQLSFEEPQNNVVVTLSDLQGKVLFTSNLGTVFNTPLEIDGQAGMYLLSVKTPKGHGVFKLIKK